MSSINLEDELVLFLGKCFKTAKQRVKFQEAADYLGVEVGAIKGAAEIIYDDEKSFRIGNYYDKVTGGARVKNLFILKSEIVERAKKIEAECEKELDRVERFKKWARDHKYIAPLIIAVDTFGPIIGLVGGILGVIAFFMSKSPE